jgi:hypothetical protein
MSEVEDLSNRWGKATRIPTATLCSECDKHFVIGDLVFVFFDDRPLVEARGFLCPDCTIKAVEAGLVPSYGTVFVDDPMGAERQKGFLELRPKEQDRIAEAFRILDKLEADLAKITRSVPKPTEVPN